MEITLLDQKNAAPFLPMLQADSRLKGKLVLGAVEDEKPCGVLVAFEEDRTLVIEHLYVPENFRRKGVAAQLLDALNNCGLSMQMDLSMACFIQKEGDDAVSKCLQAGQFEKDEVESPVYQFRFCDISPRYFSKKCSLSDIQILSLKAAGSTAWKHLCRQMEAMQEQDENGLVPVLQEKNCYDPVLSYLAVKNDSITGCILVSRQQGFFLIDYLMAMGSETPLEMMGLFQASYQMMKKTEPEDTIIRANALTDVTGKMILKMTDQKARKIGTAVSWYYGY